MISGKTVLYLLAVVIAITLLISASARRRGSLVELLRQYLKRAPRRPIDELPPFGDDLKVRGGDAKAPQTSGSPSTGASQKS